MSAVAADNMTGNGASDEATLDASTGAGTGTASAISFKKKRGGASKRKEFRQPGQALAARSDASTTTTDAAAATPAEAAAQTGSSDAAVAAAPVTVEDDTHNDADATPSAAAAAAAPATAGDDDDSSDDEATGAARPSIAFSAAAAAAAAAAVEEEEPEEADAEGGAVQRPAKRAKKDNPLAASTRNKLKKDMGLNIQSARSVMPDNRTADKQITQDIDSSKVKRDPTKPKWSGPSKPQASNVRMISRFDYQPDICKDYKETGRCGYGDSCKFMHDRGDHKAGWQIERDWNAEQEEKRKRALQGLSTDADEENFEIKAEDELPWACLICREPFNNPVVTKCKHYFCEKCALDAYMKDTKCFACRQQTHGIFNTATDLIGVIKQRAATGKDPRQELEALEAERLAEKEKANAASAGWAIP